MSTQFFQKYGRFIGPIIVLFLSLLITFIWFRKWLMFAGGEEGLPLYDPTKYLYLISHIWHDANGGSPAALLLPRIPYAWTLTVLYKLGVGPVLLQALSFFVLILTGCLSIFYLTKETIGKNLEGKLKNLVPLLAAVFYFFNPYSMSQVWGRGIYAQFFAFALIPLFLLFFILCLKRKNFLYPLLAVLASFGLSASYLVVSNAVVLWVPVLLYVAYYVVENRKEKNQIVFAIVYTILALAFWIFSNAWWVLPIIKSGSNAYLHFLKDTNNVGTLIGISSVYARPVYVIRLLQGFYFFIPGVYGKIYSNPLFQTISWIIPLISAFSMAYFKKNKGLRFFIALFAFGFFVSVGSNPPLGDVFVWFFERFPFLQAFRNPYEKAGLLLMLAYAPLFALGFVTLGQFLAAFFKKTKRKFVSIVCGTLIIVGVCEIYVWPLWTGKFTNSWVKVPEYYKNADSWFSSQPGDFRIMQMPLIGGDGVRYNWEFPYQGIEPGEFLFTKSSIGRNIAFNKVYYNVLTQRLGVFAPGAFGPDPDISKSEFKSLEFWQELAKLNIRYLVFHNDWDEKFMEMEVEPVAGYLSKQRNIKLVKTFGKLDIYQVFIPENITRIYSPNTKTEILEKSANYYRIKVFGGKDLTEIYFLDLFDPGWEAFLDGQKVDTHETVFSYANKWTIDKTGDFEVIIKYAPQDYVTKGWKITEITLILIGGVLAYTIFKKRK